MVRGKLYSVVLASIILVFIVSIIAVPLKPVAAAPPQNDVESAISRGISYIQRLMRSLDASHDVISEYPALPVVVKCVNGPTFIPGIAEPAVNSIGMIIWLVPEAVSVSQSFYSSYTLFVWDIDLRYVVQSTGDQGSFGKIRINEYKYPTYTYATFQVTSDNLDPSWKPCGIYVEGLYLMDFSYGNYNSYSSTEPISSMRTSIRHVDVIGYNTLNALGYSVSNLYNLVYEALTAAWGTFYGAHDIYNPMLKDLATPPVVSPNEFYHFYDAHKFSDGYGWDRLRSYFNQNGWIYTTYPSYPYKSKVVNAGEASSTNGGTIFLNYLSCIGDPLYYLWLGLYYAYNGDYTTAQNYWYQAMQNWDGNGFVVPASYNPSCPYTPGPGYSTVRLATGIALGTILAYNGYIEWTTVDNMVNILLQLQWSGEGYYSPDGSTTYYMYAPDHKDGFVVSYGPVGSYGFVPFRPSLVEDVLDPYLDTVAPWLIMKHEYGGIIVTNAEATILSVAALKQYLDKRYPSPPPPL